MPGRSVKMDRKRMRRSIVGVLVIAVLAVLAFVAANGFSGTPVPAMGGASPAGLRLTP